MAYCADCGLTVSDIKNRVLLTSNKSDISKWDEHIVTWALEAEKQIGTFNGLSRFNNVLLNGNGEKKVALPDNLYMLESLCFLGRADVYTGASSRFNTRCGCNNESTCGAVHWNINGCYITTDKPVYEVVISYLALPVDEDGFPYIKQTHGNAVESYIRFQMLQANFDDGKVQPYIYQTRYNEWLRRRNEAKATDEIPTDNEMMVLGRIWGAKMPVLLGNYESIFGYSVGDCSNGLCDTGDISSSVSGSSVTPTPDTADCFIHNGQILVAASTYQADDLIGTGLAKMIVYVGGNKLKWNDPNAADNAITAFDTATGTLTFKSTIPAGQEVVILIVP